VRGERGEHHVARIGGWGVPLELFAYELEERRGGHEDARGQVKDVERGVGAQREEAQTA